MKSKIDNDLEQVFRRSNRVWAAMYYDELIDTPDFQISYLSEANRLYYNCSHVLRNDRNRETSLKIIEEYFVKKGIRPAVYLDPNADRKLESYLITQGYKEVLNERENWYRRLLDSELSIAADTSLIKSHIFYPEENECLFEDFLRINALVNQIPY